MLTTFRIPSVNVGVSSNQVWQWGQPPVFVTLSDDGPSTFTFPCRGETHRIIVHPSGRLTFPDHPSIRDEVVGNRFGGDCACATLLQGCVEGRSVWYGPLPGITDIYRYAMLRIATAIWERSDTRREERRNRDIVDPFDLRITNRWVRAALLFVPKILSMSKFPEYRPSITDTVSAKHWINEVYLRGFALVDGYFVRQCFTLARAEQQVLVDVLSRDGPATVRIYKGESGWHIYPQDLKRLEGVAAAASTEPVEVAEDDDIAPGREPPSSPFWSFVQEYAAEHIFGRYVVPTTPDIKKEGLCYLPRSRIPKDRDIIIVPCVAQ